MFDYKIEIDLLMPRLKNNIDELLFILDEGKLEASIRSDLLETVGLLYAFGSHLSNFSLNENNEKEIEEYITDIKEVISEIELEIIKYK